MGAYFSCVCSHLLQSNTIKLIFVDGRLQEFEKQVKAAEIMVENPQQFVCEAAALHVGRRINPLPADEDLELGHLYFLLPMSKLQGVVSRSDLASIALKARSAMKASSKSSVKIFPMLGEMGFFFRGQSQTYLHENGHDDGDLGGDLECDLKIVALPKMDFEGLSDLQMGLGKYRVSSCRSWKPKLETIREVERLRA
ncbi:hypothetical protein SUGI_0977150 [Cryptomeria japonica]|uniref:uncharacterized protein LOC131067437 n=1 Tax=Cryptomeria japonica TaxID=3369 RepID=UPI00241489B1|nr:uncharacterized protein LOC131067437 [Cryptomeria japonica]GLJ46356.1 hypothetical protein SUGI_0977150 [Cryptomeria japonica]